jgi:hypothetical protein
VFCAVIDMVNIKRRSKIKMMSFGFFAIIVL